MGNTWDEREERFEERPVRTAMSATVRTGLVVAVAVLVVLAIGAGIWALQVGTSDVKGKGDAEIIKNDAKNRIRSQEGFWIKYEGIVQADKNLNLTAELLEANPTSAKLTTELAGQKMICNQLVGEYNAASQKFTEKDFKDAELPHQIDDTSPPAIDCKENDK
jgi:hypothetical protein